MSFSLLTDDALCEVAKGNMPLLLALQATCKDARRVLSSWLKMQVSVRLQVRLEVPDAHHGPGPCELTLALTVVPPLPLTSTDASRPAASPRRSAASPPHRSRGCARSAYTAAASPCRQLPRPRPLTLTLNLTSS